MAGLSRRDTRSRSSLESVTRPKQTDCDDRPQTVDARIDIALSVRLDHP